MAGHQLDFLGAPEAEPQGLVYRPEFMGEQEEAFLAEQISGLPFSPFEFHGFLGNRRTVLFGWRYAFDGTGLIAAAPIPEFLLPLRIRAAALSGFPADALEHVLVTEYAPGAGIGWHRDRSVFGDVVGVSLLASARLRFRRKIGSKWERAVIVAGRRSAYLLTGPARTEWEHSIPAMEELRYSITFRTLRR